LPGNTSIALAIKMLCRGCVRSGDEHASSYSGYALDELTAHHDANCLGFFRFINLLECIADFLFVRASESDTLVERVRRTRVL